MRNTAVIGLFGAAFALRIVWGWHPGLFMCATFWAAIMLAALVCFDFKWMPGMLCNASVTLANGGFMPSTLDVPPTGIYISADSNTNLPWLCDRFDGASVGDCLLFAALLWTLVIIGRRAWVGIRTGHAK